MREKLPERLATGIVDFSLCQILNSNKPSWGIACAIEPNTATAKLFFTFAFPVIN